MRSILWSVVARARSVWRNVVHRHAVEQDLDEELWAYVALRTAEQVAAGAAEDVARRTALAEMGGIDHVKAEIRVAHVGWWLSTVLADLRSARRTFPRRPVAAAIAVLLLTLGVAGVARVRVAGWLHTDGHEIPGCLTVTGAPNARRPEHLARGRRRRVRDAARSWRGWSDSRRDPMPARRPTAGPVPAIRSVA